MKYLIIPAKEVQAGDVIFTNKGDDIRFCGRVIGLTVPRPRPEITQFRVEVVVGDEKGPEGTHTVLDFRHGTQVGVVREDEYVDVDIGAILGEIEREGS